MRTDPRDIRPEDCPEPGWHRTHHYCPACSWVNPDAPKSPEQRIRETLELIEEGVRQARDKAEIQKLTLIFRTLTGEEPTWTT